MNRRLLVPALMLALSAPACAADVLIVADEMPQMQLLTKILQQRAKLTSDLVEQAAMPPSVSKYRTVIVFVHKALQEPVETRLVEYAKSGGKLIVVHHSISHIKGKNKYWFPTLGVTLPPGDPARGGYKWINPVTYAIVNLAPGHYITSHKVRYPEKIVYQRESGSPEAQYPGFTVQNSEVFLNHTFTDGQDKTILMGFKWRDPKSDKTWMQDRAGWYKRAGRGWVIYLQPGHAVSDLEIDACAQIFSNAVTAKLK